MKVLLVEDELAIAAIVKRGLEEEGYRVDICRDGNEALSQATSNQHACIILDLMLPGLDGWKVCETLRARKVTTPILMLTARGEIEDRVKGLRLGADDYLPKPFAFPELSARVQALIRRDTHNRGSIIEIGRLRIDDANQTVENNGKIVTLTPQEYSMLLAMARNEGKPVSRDYITEVVWGAEETYSNSVDAHICQLRKKIDTGFSAKLIHTVHRVGYQLRSIEEV